MKSNMSKAGLNRRKFLSASGTAAVGAAAITTGWSPAARAAGAGQPFPGPSPEELDRVAAAPVLKLDGLSSPVVIDSIRLLKKGKEHLVHVRSKDGAEGVSLTNPPRTDYLAPILRKLIIPFFIKKDARDLENLLWELYRYQDNYKLYGLAL